MSEYISVQELASKTGKTAEYIRRLCRENKLPNIREQLPGSTTQKYMIQNNTPELNKYFPEVKDQKKLVPEPVTQQDNNLVVQLIEQIKELSKQAGKVELLEDIKKKEEGDTKYWKDKYFELQNQVTELNKEVVELKTKLDKKLFKWF